MNFPTLQNSTCAVLYYTLCYKNDHYRISLHTLSVAVLGRRLLLLLEQLLAGLVRQMIYLVAQESLDAAVDARNQPENGVHQIHPHGSLHRSRAAALVLVVAVPLEEDAREDSEDDNPHDEQEQVPGEGSVRLEQLDPAADEGDRAERGGEDEEDG